MHHIMKRLLATVAVGGAGLLVPGAFADLSFVLFHVTAASEDNTMWGEWTYAQEVEFGPDGTYSWELPDEAIIEDSAGGTGQEIARILPAADVDGDGTPELTSIFYQEDPIVNLNFAVQSGATATNFTVSSALLSFPGSPIPAAVALAEADAAFAISDVNGNGATLSLLPATLGGYEAGYNGLVGFGATSFTQLITGFAAGIGGSANSNGSAGPVIIGGPGNITSMSSQVRFRLTARDLASGTTNFSITPEPASLALLLLGGLAFTRRS